MKDSITVYSLPSCGMCKMLKTQLTKQNIVFDVCEDIAIMEEKKIKAVPILEVNGHFYNFKEALLWLKEQDN